MRKVLRFVVGVLAVIGAVMFAAEICPKVGDGLHQAAF